MISFLLLAAALQPSSLPMPTSSAAPAAEAGKSPLQEPEARRTALDAAIAGQLLGSGYFRLVTDKQEQASAAAGFENRLRSAGIPASVSDCHWIGLVAAGSARGNRSYGGACSVRMGTRRPSDFLICAADLGAVTLVQPSWFAWDAEYIELFIRRTCL
jgi:hypothetical protein